MAKKTRKDKAFIWFDPEGEQIEIVFGQREGAGEMVSSQDPRIMLRVDEEGRIIGALIMFLDSFLDKGIQDFTLSPMPTRPGELIARKSED
ncbi:MAG: hypothetical protein L0177_10135 [Chloroflexi bacterium]|nr:hypothetical protein [Chloroflexota bacterium]